MEMTQQVWKEELLAQLDTANEKDRLEVWVETPDGKTKLGEITDVAYDAVDGAIKVIVAY